MQKWGEQSEFQQIYSKRPEYTGERQSCSILDAFEKVSDLSVNYEKTEAFWHGSCRGSKETMFHEKKIKWVFNKGIALGVCSAQIINKPYNKSTVNILCALPSAPHNLKEAANDIFYDYLQDCKTRQNQRRNMINDLDKEGQKMIDIFCFNRALKSTWLQKCG